MVWAGPCRSDSACFRSKAQRSSMAHRASDALLSVPGRLLLAVRRTMLVRHALQQQALPLHTDREEARRYACSSVARAHGRDGSWMSCDVAISLGAGRASSCLQVRILICLLPAFLHNQRAPHPAMPNRQPPEALLPPPAPGPRLRSRLNVEAYSPRLHRLSGRKPVPNRNVALSLFSSPPPPLPWTANHGIAHCRRR